MHRIRYLNFISLPTRGDSATCLVSNAQSLQNQSPIQQLQGVDFSMQGDDGHPSPTLCLDIICRLLSSGSALRHLSFNDTCFSWGILGAGALSGLRRLSVHRCYQVAETSFADVVNGLGRLQALESLRVWGSISLSEELEEYSSYPKIHLPRLRSLSLNSAISTILA